MRAFGPLIPGALAFAYLSTGADTACAAIVDGDPLEVAVAAPTDAVKFKNDSFEPFAAEAISYDDNIYRLSPEVTNLRALTGIGPDASRQDRIDTVSAGVDGLWNPGRQTVALDLRVDDNRFAANSNLDNISNNDKLIWNWNVGSVLSGQLGAAYTSGLISFVNSTDYARDIYAETDYFGAGRYQLGPRWAIFGGVLDSATTLSDPALQLNDSHAKSIHVGSEYASGDKDSLGVEYRYTDARYPLGTALNSDYREDTARFVVRHAFSDKTNIDANVGVLKRDYADPAIGNFSGDVWRLSAKWQPTEKMQVQAEGWRNLQAYVTAQSDYYVAKGERISPQWAASEKITVALALGFEDQKYIGVAESELSQASRHDTVTTSQATVKYTPLSFLIFDFGYAYEKRTSNQSLFHYNDNVLSARVTVKH